jgi:methyl-accepting chemotaxis protein
MSECSAFQFRYSRASFDEAVREAGEAFGKIVDLITDISVRINEISGEMKEMSSLKQNFT